MDDLNALAEALVSALNEGDDAKAAEIRAPMDRFVLALGWNIDGVLPALVAYAGQHKDDELFAPAFALRSIAPDCSEAVDLLARLSVDARTLMERLR